jgi:Fe-S-cluster containining protein
MNTNIDFECTMCGNCCHDLRLPLTVSEALAWLARGNEVQILCEAVPWLEEPDAGDLQAAHKRRRSFAAVSGSLPVRVVVILTGAFVGPCPNLLADMRCGIYEERPLVCRIYPAEINPFIELTPANKGCPPEAWTPGLPPLMRAGKLVDAATATLIGQSRATDMTDVPIKQRVCEVLGVDAAALVNEGFVVYSPRGEDLRAALERACESTLEQEADAAGDDDVAHSSPPEWRFVSNRQATVDTLVSVDARGVCVTPGDALPFEYLGFFPAAT